MASGIAHRKWFLWRNDYADDAAFEEAVELELARNRHMCDRLGIAVIPSPVRDKIDRPDGRPSEYFSLGWMFQTASIPTARPPAAPVIEPDDWDEAPDGPPSLAEQRSEWLHEHPGESLPRELQGAEAE